MKIGATIVDFKGLIIDGPAGPQSIEPIIMKLLRVLVERAGEVMTREELINTVWGVDFGGDERLSRAISILRKALGDRPGERTHIVTISKVGYRLIAEVSDEPVKTSTGASAPKVEKLTPASTTKNVETDTHPTADLTPANSYFSKHEHTPDTPKFSFRRLVSISMVAASVLIIGYWTLSFFRTNETFSVQARIDRGLSKVEAFTTESAILEAQDIFNSILAENPDNAAARAGLAFSLFREYTHLERDPAVLERAKSHAETAFRQDEHLALSNIATAWAFENDGNLDRAHELLDLADVLNLNHPLTLEGRFRIYARNGQLEEAIDTLETGIKAHPNNALFYGYLGHAHVKQNMVEEAEASFKRAIDLDPDNAHTYAQLAHTLYLQGRTEEAISEIQTGLSINETPLLYNNLGTYLFFKGHYVLAASAFEKTLDLSGDTHSHLYWANLADAYRWSKDKTDEAATAYRRALQLLRTDLDNFPNNTNLKSRAAMIHAKLGNLDQARDFMNRFSLTPESESIQLYRAVVTYEILSDRVKALECLEAALEAGYPLIEIYNDPELSKLRQDPRYHRLLAKTQIE